MQPLDFIIIGLYLAFTLGIGIYYGRHTKNLKDFAVGNRNFSITILFTSIFATFTGSNTILGFSERMYSIGMVFGLIILCYSTYKVIVATYIVPRFSQFKNCLTVGDVLATRYGKFGQTMGGIFSFIKCAGTVAAQIKGLSLVIAYFFHVNDVYSTGVVTFIVIAYTSYGGIRSVSFTDFMQFLLLIVVIPLVCAFLLYEAGGYVAVTQKIFVAPDFSETNVYFLLSVFVIAFYTDFTPPLVQRLLMSDNLKKISSSLKISAAVNIPFVFIVALMAGAAYVLNSTHVEPKFAALSAIDNTLPVGIKGLVVAGLLAVIMSTIDSMLNTASIVFTRDIYTLFSKKKPSSSKSLLRIAQLSSLIIGVSGFFIALYMDTVFNAYLFSLGPWVAVILMPLYGVIFNYHTSKERFILAGIFSVVTLLVAKYGLNLIGGVPIILSTLVSAGMIFYEKLVELFTRLPGFILKTFMPRLNQLAAFCVSVIRPQQKQGLGNYDSIRRLEGVLNGFSVAAFMCFFAGYFVSFSLEPKLNAVRLIGSLLSIVYLVRLFYPIRWKQQLTRYSHFFYFYCGIFGPLWMYWLMPNLGNLTVLILFISAAALLFSVRGFVLSLVFTCCTLALFSGSMPWETHLSLWSDIAIPAVITLFFVVTFVFAARTSIQRYLQTLYTLSSSMSHELKTPLASIFLLTEKAKQDMDLTEDSPMKEYLEKVTAITKKTQETMAISLSGLRFGGALQAPLEPISIKPLLETVIERYPFQPREKKVFQADIQIKPTVCVLGNEILLKAAVDNLLKNAFEALAEKVEPVDPVVKLSAHVTQAGFLEIVVYDTGIGIPYDMTTKIFDPSISTKTYGSGIGLPFTYNVALYMFGDLFCASKPGHWTDFTLKLPLLSEDEKKHFS